MAEEIDYEQEFLQAHRQVQPVEEEIDYEQQFLQEIYGANAQVQQEQKGFLDSIGEFLVDSVSDVGTILGGAGGAVVGGGLGAIPGAAIGAGLGVTAEQALRLLLGMDEQEQLVAAAEDPVLNDLINTLGFDLIGGLATKAGIKGVKKGGEVLGSLASKGLTQVDDVSVEAAKRLADQGIDLTSVPAFEGGERLLGPETAARLAKPTATKEAQEKIVQNNLRVLQDITGASADDLTTAKSFSRGEEVIEGVTENIPTSRPSQVVREELDIISDRTKQLDNFVKSEAGTGPEQFRIRQELDELSSRQVELTKELSSIDPKIEKAYQVDTLKQIAAGKKVPLAKDVISAVTKHPERIEAALTATRGKLKGTLRDEMVTQLTKNTNKLKFLEDNKESLLKVLPDGENSFNNLQDFYTAIKSSSAERLVPNPASAVIGGRGAQTVMWFGRNLTRSGALAASGALFGDIVGGAMVTMGSRSFAKRVLLNPKYSQIAIKAARKEPLTTPELNKLMSGIAGMRLVVNQIDSSGKKVGKGRELVLEERNEFVPRQATPRK